MTDDIVTRLRNRCHTSAIRDLPCTIVAPQGCPPCEAADEIDYLRAEVSRLTLLANLWESEFNAAVNALTDKAVRSGNH